MIVYRVEHSITGDGPYKDPEMITRKIHGWEDKNHPSPYHDGIYSFAGMRFGFVTLEKTLEWFSSLQAYLQVRGFQISVYVTNVVKLSKSGKQCAFEYDDALLVGVVDWSTL